MFAKEKAEVGDRLLGDNDILEQPHVGNQEQGLS
jgi:hypothetical protein